MQSRMCERAAISLSATQFVALACIRVVHLAVQHHRQLLKWPVHRTGMGKIEIIKAEDGAFTSLEVRAQSLGRPAK